MEFRPVAKPHPGLIGALVVIQVFGKDDEGHLKSESFKKHVGKLKAYQISDKTFTFKIDGLPVMTTYDSSHYYEIFRVLSAKTASDSE